MSSLMKVLHHSNCTHYLRCEWALKNGEKSKINKIYKKFYMHRIKDNHLFQHATKVKAKNMKCYITKT